MDITPCDTSDIITVYDIADSDNENTCSSDCNKNYHNYNALNIKPTLWGNIFWNFLHDIAKYCINASCEIIGEIKNMVSTLPYILPCSSCRNHCLTIYNNQSDATSLNVISDFKTWLWHLKSLINKNTGSPNICFNDYNQRLYLLSHFCSAKQLFDLLFMIAYSYPHKCESDNYRQKYYRIFFNSVAFFCSKIKHLNKFALINKYNSDWNTYSDLLNHISYNYYAVYNSHYEYHKFNI